MGRAGRQRSSCTCLHGEQLLDMALRSAGPLEMSTVSAELVTSSWQQQWQSTGQTSLSPAIQMAMDSRHGLRTTPMQINPCAWMCPFLHKISFDRPYVIFGMHIRSTSILISCRSLVILTANCHAEDLSIRMTPQLLL